MPNSEAVLLDYQNKLEGLGAGIAHAQARQSGALAMLAIAAAALVLLSIAAYSSRRMAPAWLPPLVLPVAALPWRNLCGAVAKL